MSWFNRSRGTRQASRAALVLSSAVCPLIEDLERRTLLSVPNGPYGVSAAATGPATVGVQFYDNSADETGFVIERANAAAGPFAVVASVGPLAGTGPRTYSDSSLTAAGNYFYRVKATGTSADSNFAGPATVTVAGSGGTTGTPVTTTPAAPNPGGVPNGPYAMTAVAGASGPVDLQFVDNSDNETGFVIERSASPGGAYAPVAALAPAAGTHQTISYADNTAAPATAYTYRAYAVNGSLQSALAGPVFVTTAAPVGTVTPVTPAPPSGTANPGGPPNGPYALTAAAASATSVAVSFVDNADNETGFVIKRAPGAGGLFAPVGTAGPAAGVHSVATFTDTTAAAGSTYVYRVYAVNGSYESSVAGPVTATTPAATGTTPGGTTPPVTGTNAGGPPNGPFSLSAAAINSGTVGLSFVDNADNETGFVVERGSSQSGPFAPLATLPPSAGSPQTVTFVDATAAASSTYFYRVHAVNGGYDSSTTGPAAATTPATGTSTGGTLTIGSGSVVTTNGGITVVAGSLNTGSSSYGNFPAAPTGFLVQRAAGAADVPLSFLDNANNETGFVVARGSSSFGPFATLVILPASSGTGQTVTYTDKTAVAGIDYFYWVYAVNGNNAYSGGVIAGTAAPAVQTTGGVLTLSSTPPFGLVTTGAAAATNVTLLTSTLQTSGINTSTGTTLSLSGLQNGTIVTGTTVILSVLPGTGFTIGNATTTAFTSISSGSGTLTFNPTGIALNPTNFGLNPTSIGLNTIIKFNP